MDLRKQDNDVLDWREVTELRDVLGDWGNGQDCPMSAVYYDYLFHDDSDRRQAWAGPRPAWQVLHALRSLTIHTESEKPRVARAIELLDKIATRESIESQLRAAMQTAHAAGMRYRAVQHLAMLVADQISSDWN